MKSYAGWKEEQNQKKFYKESIDNGNEEIKAAFDDLRQTISRVSESAGLMGSVKRGVFGATKGLASSLFGKNSKSAAAVPDVSSNYDLHRTSTLGTMGKTALGGMKDAAGRLADEFTGAARRRRVEDIKSEGELLLEWDKNALDVIMAKVNEVEKKIISHVQTLTQPGTGTRSTGNNSWETDTPKGNSFSANTGIPVGIAHSLQSDLPPAALNKMEERFETDPILQAFINALGKQHSFTAVNRVASDMGKTPEDLADELDKKYGASGALRNILLQKKRLTSKIVDHLKGFGHKIVKPTGEQIPTSHTITTNDI